MGIRGEMWEIRYWFIIEITNDMMIILVMRLGNGYGLEIVNLNEMTKWTKYGNLWYYVKNDMSLRYMIFGVVWVYAFHTYCHFTS